ncbi:MAG: DUF3617 domain-containing protein [Woeseiaceae bacterium]
MAAASLVCLTLTPARAADQPGVLWEMKSETVIEGFPMQMPVHTMQVCKAPEWTQAPASGDESQNCKQTSFNKTGPKVTWTVQCTNPEMMGAGEITFNGTDSYTGLIKFSAAEMNMSIKLAGKKIGGCDNPQ